MNLAKSEILIYPKKSKLIAIFLLSLVFVLIGLIFIIVGFEINIGIDIAIEDSSPMIYGIIGTVCCVFFGICGAYILERIINKSPSIVLNSEGFVDNASAIGIGLIKWNEIKEFKIYEYMGQKFLGIELVDPKILLSRTSKVKRMLLNTNKKLGTSTINIPQNTVEIPLEKVYDEVMKFYNEMEF